MFYPDSSRLAPVCTSVPQELAARSRCRHADAAQPCSNFHSRPRCRINNQDGTAEMLVEALGAKIVNSRDAKGR